MYTAKRSIHFSLLTLRHNCCCRLQCFQLVGVKLHCPSEKSAPLQYAILSKFYDHLLSFLAGCYYCGLQQTYAPLAGQASQPYSGRPGPYDVSSAAGQENYESVRQMNEFDEPVRERRRERDREKERDRDGDRDWDWERDRDNDRDWDHSRRHRSGDR